MATGLIAAIMSPRRGNRLAADALFAIDNNCGPRKSGLPGTACPGDERYLGLARSELTDSPASSAARPGPAGPRYGSVPGETRGTLVADSPVLVSGCRLRPGRAGCRC
jgi:hypothetical protein